MGEALSKLLKLFTRGAIFALLVLIVIGSLVVDSEFIKEQFPFIIKSELTLHRILSRLDPRQNEVRFVTIVAVDDAAEYSKPISGHSPTNRAYLARLLQNIATREPLAVGLDFRLLAQSPTDEDPQLLAALQELSKQGIPVVLADWAPDKTDEAPLIFRASDLPRLTTLGLANLPLDARQMPLESKIRASDGDGLATRQSFPLAIVTAYDRNTSAIHPIGNEPAIKKAIATTDFVYVGVLQRSDLEASVVSSTDIYNNEASALDRCRHRIVIIGSTAHSSATSHSDEDFIDSSYTSLGRAPNVYVWANDVEALLSGRYQRAVSGKAAFLLDVVAGFALFLLYHLFDGTKFILLFAILVAALFLTAYVFFANVGLYIDLVPVLIAVLFHLSYEYWESIRSPHGPHSSEGNPTSLAERAR